jgi:WD40 repeat protein
MGKAGAKSASQWKVRAKLPGLAYYVHALRFSPNGKVLASGVHGTAVWLSDTKTGKPLHKLDGYETVDNLAFSPDGRMLAAAGAEATNVYDVKTGRRLAALDVEGNHVSFSPDGRLLAVATKKSPLVFETKGWTQSAKLDGHKSGVTFVEFLAGGSLATCAGKEVRVWDVAGGTSTAFDHKGDTNYLCTSRDGRYVVSAGYKRHARVWDVAAKEQVAELSGHEQEVWAAAISDDGALVVTGSGEGAVRVWRMPGGALAHEFRGEGEEEAEGAPVALSAGAKLVAAGMGTVRVWEAASGKPVANLPAKAEMSCLAFSPDGKLLAAGSGDGVLIYEVRGARNAR